MPVKSKRKHQSWCRAQAFDSVSFSQAGESWFAFLVKETGRRDDRYPAGRNNFLNETLKSDDSASPVIPGFVMVGA